MFDLLSDINIVSEKSMVTSGPLKECIEIENGIRPDLHFTIDYQYPPGKLINLFGVFVMKSVQREQCILLSHIV